MTLPGKHEENKNTVLYFVSKIMKFLPLRTISRCAGWLANRRPGKILQKIIPLFAKAYGINLEEAELSIDQFHTFNEFFDRKLKDGARPIDKGDKVIVSPVDGTILTFGSLSDGIILEAKGTGSHLDDLLVMPGFKKRFLGGHYVIIYLSPRDYHRIHSPVSAKIIGYNHIPGRLYPVNSFAVNNVDRLFSLNERLTTFLETDNSKLCALVAVGATNVGSIRMVYKEELKTNRVLRKKQTDIFMNAIPINKGDEIGRFELGSTVILLFESEMVTLDDFTAGDKVQMGKAIAELK